jgi:hypothetical protein
MRGVFLINFKQNIVRGRYHAGRTRRLRFFHFLRLGASLARRWHVPPRAVNGPAPRAAVARRASADEGRALVALPPATTITSLLLNLSGLLRGLHLRPFRPRYTGTQGGLGECDTSAVALAAVQRGSSSRFHYWPRTTPSSTRGPTHPRPEDRLESLRSLCSYFSSSPFHCRRQNLWLPAVQR